MGEGGCLWVRWFTGGMNNTKTRQAGGIYGVSGHILRPMAGEISPKICAGSHRGGTDECSNSSSSSSSSSSTSVGGILVRFYVGCT